MSADLTEVTRLKVALRMCARNDNSRYEHHQERMWDGKRPRDADGGTIFLTPREIARRVLGEPDLATFSDQGEPRP